MVIKHTESFHWENTPVLNYKEENGATFKSITRQILFTGGADLPVQVRYFEISEGGWSTLERHEHIHVVWIARGSGHALVGETVFAIGERDVVSIPSGTWHQFRADEGSALGFICLVNVERDKPHLPTGEELSNLKSDAATANFIRN